MKMNATETVHCNRCNKDVLFHYDPVKHPQQLLLTICTFGLWLPMWFCMTFSPSKMCNECNRPIWNDGP